MIDWKKVNHFHAGENWGDTRLVDPELVYSLDAFRKMLGHPVYLSPVKGAVVSFTGHSEKSYHYPITGKRLCQAADVYPDCQLVFSFMRALKSNLFTGIGVYPHWIWSKKPHLRGGLHLDIRAQFKKSMWWRDEWGEYHYFNSPDEIRRLFSILIM